MTSAATETRKRSVLVWWGAGLMAVGVVAGAVAVVGAVSHVGGGLVDALTADDQATPMSAEMDLDEGTYLVYELTGTTRSGGPFHAETGRGVTVSVSDVTVTADNGASIPVGSGSFTETVSRGSSQYTGAARFEITQSGLYTVAVATPDTRVIVAPSIASGFRGALKWIGLGALSALVLFVGMVLLIVGFVRSSQSPPAAVPAGWYRDPQQQATWRWFDGTTWTDRTG